MSKEFVMVPRDVVVEAVHAARSMGWSLADKLGAVLDKPADQRHSDPDAVDRLCAKLATCNDARETLAAQLHASHGKPAERDALSQAVSNAHRVTHHYHSGNGMLDWIHSEANRLSASAEPGAPAEIDERAAFVDEMRKQGGLIEWALGWDGFRFEHPPTQGKWEIWQARAALERKL